MGEVLHVITPIEAEVLTVVRHIRNAFAHAMRPIKFTMREVAEECERLKASIDKLDKKGGMLDRLDSRRVFIGATSLMTALLGNRVTKMDSH